ncbi:unnamed protein product [Darwinula stevensoni]|uniref:Homologous recombination OB-fold protein OB-fold domain-containing protein n=1 Tax=Darwinula stevensoni TaxID=69355 RepID=A0A7R9A2Y4_9CRUS|nr:unnamed protein product [Darwinula stevensoni]CAG0890663.1 unnamed protein product [Darwinula stevensoni]
MGMEGYSEQKKRRRKFPGPAGLLNPGSAVFQNDPGGRQTLGNTNSIEVIPSSQDSEVNFEKGPWKHALEELGLDEQDPGSLLTRFNIPWVMRSAEACQFVIRKVPLLVVMLKSIEVNASGGASCVVRDRAGEMRASLHSDILKDRASLLQAGSVLLLRDIGVFSPSGLGHHRRHYLNITLQNLLRIYYTDLLEDSTVKCCRLASITDQELHQLIGEILSAPLMEIKNQSLPAPQVEAKSLWSSIPAGNFSSSPFRKPLMAAMDSASAIKKPGSSIMESSLHRPKKPRPSSPIGGSGNTDPNVLHEWLQSDEVDEFLADLDEESFMLEGTPM